MKRAPLWLFCAVAALPAAALAAAGDDLTLDPKLDLRLRYENVDQDGFADNAEALTLRTRLGLAIGMPSDFSGLVEFEDVHALGIDDYNSTANGKTGYPVVADPEDTELNQVWLAWRPNDATEAKLGRQRIILDNARFVGNVGFRQNEQTFDAGLFSHGFGNGMKLTAAHLEQVNRVFGDSNPNPLLAKTDVHAELLNVAWESGPLKLVGYGYLVDNRDAPSASTETYGLRWTAEQPLDGGNRLRGALEYATQSPYRDGADVNDADYWMAEGGFHWPSLGLDLGTEVLQGNGSYGFSTPLATLHAFQGWADVFLSTPPNGIEDRYLRASGGASEWKWQAVYHDFGAEHGGADYGTELDLALSRPLGWGISGKLEFADYNSDGFAVDTRKIWLSLEWRW